MIPGKIPEKSAGTAEKKRFYRKRVNFFALINKIKLWPSRRGVLHGIQSIQIRGKLPLSLRTAGNLYRC